MAGVHAQHGRLLISFQFPAGGRRWRCREFLGLDDTRDNRRLAARMALQIEREIAAGSFDYAARFPASLRPRRLGLASGTKQTAPTLADYAGGWLEARRARLTPATFYDYGLIVRKHLLGTELAATAIDAISRSDIDRWINDLRAAGVGPRRINMALARMRTMMRMAEEEGLIDRNPVRFVRSLREPRAAIDPFDEQESAALLAAAVPGSERALLATLLLAGLRPSEALGLVWDDLDLSRRLLLVRRSRGRFGPGMTKTTASEREVDISEPLVRELQMLDGSARQARWLFVGPRGKPLDWTNFRGRRWPRIVAAAGVRSRPPHQCRHTFATRLLAAGANPQYVAHQLGHATLAMVIRHYARWTRKPRSGLAFAPAEL